MTDYATGYPGLGGEPLDANRGGVASSINAQLASVPVRPGEPWTIELVADQEPDETVLEYIRRLTSPLLRVTDVAWDTVTDWTGLDQIPDAANAAYEQARLVVRGVYEPAAAYVSSVYDAMEPIRTVMRGAGQLWLPTGYRAGAGSGGGWLHDLQGATRSITWLLVVAAAIYLVVKLT
jgi:hypothetical protein